jgi:anti-sigma-K factor RskA
MGFAPSTDTRAQSQCKRRDHHNTKEHRNKNEAGQVTMRLNGWQRIGIVASVIWAIGATIC